MFWGWWRPQDEDFKTEILTEFRKLLAKGPVGVGLANTKDGQFFVATCVEVAFDAGGQRIHSPTPEHTPEYYRPDRFPAWFKLVDVREVTSGEFDASFGMRPVGPETLLPVWEGELSATGDNNLIPVKAPGEAILHISDLHFGDFHGFPLAHDEAGKFDNTLDQTIAEIVTQSEQQIGVLVVSGDIISRGKADGFVHARIFLQRLCKELGLAKQHVVIVPGNHDIYLRNSVNVTREYLDRLPYIDFLRSFYAEDIKTPRDRYKFTTPRGHTLTFAALNSVRPRSEALKDFGYIGRDAYEPVLKNLQETEFDSANEMRFAVFHHHLVMPPIKIWPRTEGEDEKSPSGVISVLLDAGEVVKALQQANVCFAIHGHHHYPFIAQAGFVEREGDRPIYVLGGGSAGAKRDHLEEAFSYNSVAIYLPDQGSLNIQIWKYSRAISPERFLSTRITP